MGVDAEMIARCPKCGTEMEGDVAIGDLVECPCCNETFTLEQRHAVVQEEVPPVVQTATDVGKRRSGSYRPSSSIGKYVPGWESSRQGNNGTADTIATTANRKGFRLRDFVLGALAMAVIYTLGIVLYPKLVGKGAFTGAPASNLAGQHHPAPPAPVPTSTKPAPSLPPATPKQPDKQEAGAALYKEAMRYYNGGDVLQDYTKAVDLLIKASELGSAEADAQLASIYWEGDANQKPDQAKAISYAQKSGDRKTQLAHQTLGRAFLWGVEGVQPQDFEAAYSEFSNASDYYYSQFLVGLMRYHGVGTNEDKKGAAEKFFSICKRKPDSSYAGLAALCLGYMYMIGDGVGRNVKEGASWMDWGFKASGRNKYVSGSNRGNAYGHYLLLRDHFGVCDIWPGEMNLLDKAIGRYLVETDY